ncbi:MAG: response regulator transcription factor [Cyclobacteriaceae bacterium]|jgi:two-component system, OmpR family, copper resistance phosphate regulon response regulator CusR|nr:response regulator transcription factor [Cyclobacteriaceae bacterium]
MNILLVEDERKTIQYIKKGLEEHGYEVDTAEDGKSGKNLAFRNEYNLIITDVMMPHLSGTDLCKELRKAKNETPILMLTALGDTDDVVAGLDSGADDYLAKPFEFKELLARIRALTKRQPKLPVNENQIRFADLTLDLNSKSVVRAGKKIELTSKEFSLLEYFLRNQGRVIPRAELSKHVWNVDFDTGTNMVEVYVNYLRKKIDKDFESKLIHTQFGMGYILKES